MALYMNLSGVSQGAAQCGFGFGSLKPLFDASLSLIQQRGWRALAAGRGVHRKGFSRLVRHGFYVARASLSTPLN
jgi:hypothetical protein